MSDKEKKELNETSESNTEPKEGEEKSEQQNQEAEAQEQKAQKKVYKVSWDKKSGKWHIYLRNKKELISRHNTKKQATEKSKTLVKGLDEPSELIIYKMDGNVDQKLFYGEEDEEKEKSKRQKEIQVDKLLSRSLEAKEAGKRKDLRDPITRRAMSAGEWLKDHITSILIVLIIAVVVAFLVIRNVSARAENERIRAMKLSTADSITELKTYLPQERSQEQRALIYQELLRKYENDTNMNPLTRYEEMIAYANRFFEEFDGKPEYSVIIGIYKEKEKDWKKDLEVLKLRKEGEETEIEKPDVKPEILPSSDTMPILVKLNTNFGDLYLELFDEVTPNTVSALIYLIQDGFYDKDGPGGYIKREESSSGVSRLTFGEFPAIDFQNRTKKLSELKDIEPRLKHLAPKWEVRFDERSIGWTLPFEPQGIQQACKAGALILWLENNSEPQSGSTKFSILLEDDEDLDGKYVVIGSLKRFQDDLKLEFYQKTLNIQLDFESLTTATRINRDGIAINYAQILRLKAKRRNIEIFTQVDDDKFEKILNPNIIKVEDGFEYLAIDLQSADYIKVVPGNHKLIPAGSYYESEGKIVKAETDVYKQLHSAKTLKFIKHINSLVPPGTFVAPFFTSATASALAILETKNIPVYVDEIDENGDLLARKHIPKVLYPELPVPLEVRKQEPPKVGPFTFTKDKDSPLFSDPSRPGTPPAPPRLPMGAGSDPGISITPR